MPEEFVLERFVLRWLLRGLAGILLLAMAAYVMDWLVWRGRVATGGGMGSVQVDRFTVAELKDGKEAYYPDGSTLVDCSKSIFAQGGSRPCWWVERHREVVDRY